MTNFTKKNQMGGMRLYHFTSLIDLPFLLREGITRPDDVRPVPNLTTNGDPQAQVLAGGATDKSKVRLTVHIPPSKATRLEWWVKVCIRFRLDEFDLNKMDSTWPGWPWFLFWGLVHPKWVEVVEIREDFCPFRPCSGDALRDLLVAIDEEREKLVSPRPGHVALKPGEDDSWLLDGPDRWLWVGVSKPSGVLGR